MYKPWFPYVKPTNSKKAILAFHFAGGTAAAYRPLTKSCPDHDIYAVQLPGRERRAKEPFLKSCQEVARAVYGELMSSGIWDSKEWTIVAHSMGTWMAYEFMLLLQDNNKPLPPKVIFSCFPSPVMEPSLRPWKKGSEISLKEFQDELRGWSIDERIFQNPYWPMFSPMLYADCHMYESYLPTTPHTPSKLATKVHLLYAAGDKKITPSMVQDWKDVFDTVTGTEEMEGNHNQLMDTTLSLPWFDRVSSLVKN